MTGSMAAYWWYLIIAVPFGVLGTISMKLSHGFDNWRPLICMLFFYAISFVALTFAIQHIDLSVVYALWSGVGTILVAIFGVFILRESISLSKIISIGLIVLGVLGIHLTYVPY
ncbi:MAG: hypothetical protein ACD_45C00622G0004 [uncultured bacterium]|nr:MAG: hypothetical protein ACD_45C00622G0004 [uncultured bacterium]